MKRKLLLLFCLLIAVSINFVVTAADEEPLTYVISDFEPGEDLWIGYDQSDQINPAPPREQVPKGYFDTTIFYPGHFAEVVKLNDGFIPSDSYVKYGKTSGKWGNTIKNNRLVAWKFDHDWSKYSYFSVWIYSEVANKSSFSFAFYSENPKEYSDDYYVKQVIVNWRGWRLVEIPFTEFRPNRAPIGWHKIDFIKIASSGWGNTALADTVLHFDRMMLSNESVLNETLNDIPVEFKINERPGLFVNKAELKEAKEKATKYEWAKQAYQKVKMEADSWLAREIKLPATGGGYYHAGGDDYLITAEHYDYADAAKALSLMYWLENNEAYAKKAAEILLGYKDKYLTYKLHDRNGREVHTGGRVTAQAINEARWMISLAWAYDLLYDRFTPAERKEIEDKIFRPVGKLLMANNEGRHNHQSWYNSGVGVLGFLLKDPKYIRHALYKYDSGFFFQMEQSITSDGFWYEGSGHYHYYALRCIKYLTDAAQHSGMDLYGNPAYRSMYSFPITYANPAGELPTLNDGRVVVLTDDERTELFEAAYRYTKDPNIVPILKGSSRNSIEALLYGVAELPEVKLPPLKSESLTSGQVVLRSGQNGKVENYVAVNGMPYAGGHSHYDKLGIVIYAAGRNQAPDPSSIKYENPMHNGWFKHTVGHNTVALNERNQAYSVQANLINFASGPVVQMTRMSDERAYPGSTLDRTVLLTDWYIFDLFQVNSKSNNKADWIYHNFGKLSTDLKLSPVTLPKVDGYKYLENPTGAKANGQYKLTWTNGDSKMDLLQLTNEATEVFVGNGKVAAPVGDVVSPEIVPAVIVRKTGKNVVFNSLLVPSIGDFKYEVSPYSYSNVDKTPVSGAAYSITSSKGNDVIYFTTEKPKQVKVDTLESDANLVWFRKAGKVISEVFMANGSYISSKGWSFSLSDLIAGPMGEVSTMTGGVSISIKKKLFELKVDVAKPIVMKFKGKKVKSLEFYEEGKWVEIEPIEVEKGEVSFLVNSGSYRLNF